MKEDILIFWHHVGREHGGLNYTDDIRKNSQEVIEHCLQLKEERWRKDNNPHRFIKFDDNILVELPPEYGKKVFIIVYFINEGLQFEYRPEGDNGDPLWIVDIVDIREIRPNVFCVSDLFIDVTIHDDGSYRVLDMDEFTMAIELDVLDVQQVSQALKSLSMILDQMHERKFPSQQLMKIKDLFFRDR